MTRETKIGLLVGTAIILVIGIFVSHHLSQSGVKTPPTYTNLADDSAHNLTPGMGNAGGSGGINTPVIPTHPIDPGSLTLNGGRMGDGITPIPVPVPPGPGVIPGPGAGRSLFGDVPTTQPSPPRPSSPGPGVAAAGGTTVKVQKGDTLSKLAAKYLGSANKWPELLKANDTLLHGKATALGEGMTITIPATTATRTTTGATHFDSAGHAGTPAAGTTGAKTYVVQEGDTLSSIARKTLGDPNKWQLIFNANKTVLGNNPAYLKVGQTLTIPTATPAPIPSTTTPRRRATPAIPLATA